MRINIMLKVFSLFFIISFVQSNTIMYYLCRV